ncbi:MAG: hypothetical protein COA67_00380 [Lutibacter sp.]|nr:MAG: hypothetical protein COA67_00380 [Lutibacter sp.]
MKKLIYLFSIFSLLFLFNSCKKIEVTIEPTITTETTIGNLCETTKAVESNSCYNTEKGFAVLYIQIPKNHILSFDRANSTKTALIFNSIGKEYGNNTKTERVIVKNLSTNVSGSLNVKLNIKYDEYMCGDKIEKLGVKHKESDVQGIPVTPCLLPRN